MRAPISRLPAIWLSSGALALAAACGGPSGPGPVQTPAPTISCGAPIVVENVVNVMQAVSFPIPQPSGGASPVSTTCAPNSGADFPLGDTTVTCTATDSLNRQASCSFVVTLRHRQMALTRYLAFGDSHTAGENGRLGSAPFIDVANAYPTFLQQFFTERIRTQQIVVVNSGLSGEKVTDPETDARLKTQIARHQAQVVLLLEGINDLNAGSSPQSIVSGLRDHIRTAKERGAQFVFVSTLPPVAPEVCMVPPAFRCRGLDTPTGAVAATNDRIRGMVPASGGHLVDPYDVLNSNRAAYIDADGLHLKPEGNRVIATAFWDRIVQVIPAPQLGLR